VVHAQGKLVYAEGDEVRRDRLDTAAIKGRCPKRLGRQECYEKFRSLGIKYGASFQPIQELFHSSNESISVLRAPDQRSEELTSFELNLSLMDGALQTAIGLLAVQIRFTCRLR
jgi:polyketide synthase PksN